MFLFKKLLTALEEYVISQWAETISHLLEWNVRMK